MNIPRPGSLTQEERSHGANTTGYGGHLRPAHLRAGRSLKRRHPGEDVMSILLQAEDEGGKITTVEFENMFFLFAVAGNDQLVLKRLPVRWKKAALPRAC